MKKQIDVSHIVVNGCSFSYGQGLEDIRTQSWAALLAKKLNVPIVNISAKGAGNDKIMRKTYQYFYKNLQYKNNPFYVIGMSQSIRREEYVIDYKDNNVKDLYQLSCWGDEPIEKAIYEQYDSKGLQAVELRKVLNWASIYNLFKANNVNYVIGDFMPTEDFYIKKHIKDVCKDLHMSIYTDPNMIGMFNEITKYTPKLSCGHDSAEGHELIFEKIYDEINKRYEFKLVEADFLKTEPFFKSISNNEHLANYEWF